MTPEEFDKPRAMATINKLRDIIEAHEKKIYKLKLEINLLKNENRRLESYDRWYHVEMASLVGQIEELKGNTDSGLPKWKTIKLGRRKP